MPRSKKVIIKSWKDAPRLKDKLAIVGFSATTRDMTPFDDPEFEIWGLNEEYNYEWMKRFDRWFQIHPRWDFTREGNMNHVNHPNWLFNKTTTCMRCKGKGHLNNVHTNAEIDCPECGNTGTYTPPASRKGLIIYMQEQWDDIPGSIAYPLQEAQDVFPFDYPYFTSSVSFMLTLAYMMGYKEVHLYGFDMGTDTEYHYQRANGEFVMGYLMAKGMKIVLPPQSQLLRGELYGYKNMKTGFRQNLELRKTFLEAQEKSGISLVDKAAGKVELLQKMQSWKVEDLTPEKILETLKEYLQKYDKIKHKRHLIQGAITEVGNLTSMYDEYFKGNDVGSMEETLQFTNAEYDNG